MIIEPTCNNCGKKIKVKVNKVDKLQARVKELEKELFQLKAIIKFKENNLKPNSSDLFGGADLS